MDGIIRIVLGISAWYGGGSITDYGGDDGPSDPPGMADKKKRYDKDGNVIGYSD